MGLAATAKDELAHVLPTDPEEAFEAIIRRHVAGWRVPC
jgi:hypothetical protein